MPHQNLEIENGNRTPNRLRQHVWLDVSTFTNVCSPPTGRILVDPYL